MEDADPKAFPLKMQYVPAVRERRAGVNHSGDNDNAVDDNNLAQHAMVENEPVENEPEHPQQGEKRAEPAGRWNYAAVKNQYIADTVAAEQCSRKDARSSWEGSETRRALLGSISVSELKRRKFLPKGAELNPWARA